MRPHRIQLHRRRLLAGLGLAGLAPFVPWTESEAELTGVPKRLILFFHPYGTIPKLWRPTGSGMNFSFTGEITAPLEPFKSDLVVIDGLFIDIDGQVGHHAHMARMWTGAPLDDTPIFTNSQAGKSFGWGTGISVDQFVAAAIEDTPVRSLELAVNTVFEDPRTRMIYSGPKQPITPRGNPFDVYNLLFSGGVDDVDALAQLKARRRSVLDFVGGRLDRLYPVIGQGDRVKVDAHLAAIQEIEHRLDTLTKCEAVAPDPAFDSADMGDFLGIARSHIDLLVAAMACDLTRVGSIMLRDERGGRLSWLGNEDLFHEHSHAWDDGGASATLMRSAYRDFTTLFVYLLEKLAAVTTPDGQRLLDHTLVAWGTTMATGTHEDAPVPFILAGSCQGHIQTGRYLKFDNPPHNQRLLVSICNAFGFPDQQKFGVNDTGTGGLPGLL